MLILIAFVKSKYDMLCRCSFLILSEAALGFMFRRRSRSPPQREPKARSFSPAKRKLSPKRERVRERPREQERDRERRSRPAITSPRKRAR
jgi:hypothetical protein